MKYLAVLVILTALLSCCSHALDRNLVRERVILRRISRSTGRLEPIYSEVDRRFKRQTFPSDDEDGGGSGASSQDTDVTVSTTQNNLLPEQPPTVPTDWAWYRTSINFLDSIYYTEDLEDYNTDTFVELSDEIMVDVEEYIQSKLEGYYEATPLMFQQQENGDVIVLIDVGFCLSQSISDVTKTLTSLTSGGQIGRFRVSEDGFSIRLIGVDSGRMECVPGPVLPTSNVPPPSESEVPSVQTTTEAPPFDVGFSSTPTTSRSTKPPPCRPDQATCSNLRCIDRSYVCDGVNDCLDFSDEPESCGIVADRCDPTEFLCLGTGVCAQKIWRCDGDDDCGNGYDESNCPTASPDARCASIQFECRNRVCIPNSYHCDGQQDCDDNSDEEGCSPPVVITPPQHLVSAVEGETVTLDCEAVGVPNPVISWRVNWGNVPPAPRVTMTSANGKGTLTIRKIKLSDQGAYTCEAINPNGSILGTPDAVVTVTERPKTTPEPTFPSEPGGPTEDAGFCPPGEYNTSPDAPDQCKPCWCSNRSKDCVSSKLEFSKVEIEFTEPNNKQEVTLEPTDLEGNPEGFQPVTENQIDVNPPARELQLIDLSKRFLAAAHYWSLPAQFLGAKINSYGGTLTFSFSYNNSYHLPSTPTNHTDVILEGNGKKLHYKSKGPHPEPIEKHTTEVLLEEDQFKTPEGDTVSREDMLNVLGRLDRVLIRTVYDKSMLSTGVGDVKLLVAEPSASRGDGGGTQTAGVIAHAVEECVCPPGYIGLSCEITCEFGNTGQRCNPGPPEGFEDYSNDVPAIRFLCDVGYTGWDCKECTEGYVSHKSECVPHLDRRCNAGADEERRLGKDCKCKLGLEGRRCDQCKPGYYYMSDNNEDGCLKCHCMGISSVCSSTTWNRTVIAMVLKDAQHLTLTNEAMTDTFPDSVSVEGTLDGGQLLQVSAQMTSLANNDNDTFYWVLPEKFLGNKLTSYGGKLRYTIYFTDDHNSGPRYTIPRVKLIGNGITLKYINLKYPAFDEYAKFIIELSENNWLTASGTAPSREEFLIVLSKLDAVLIRASHSTEMITSKISNIFLDIAVPRHTGKSVAHKVEQCSCPAGYTGSSCEDCAAGYSRFDSNGYPAVCRPCECNGHSDSCDSTTGACVGCQNNTIGKRCEKCAPGYYGVATRGTSQDCRECACPGTGANSFSETCRYDVSANRLTCTACREGYTGQRCESCAPGYEGNPTAAGGLCRKRASPTPTQHLPEVTVSAKNVDARKGSSITIRCAVNSSSPVAVSWHHENSNNGPLPHGARVTNRGRTLRLSSFSSSQVGTYQCAARNKFGSTSDSVSISLASERPMIRVRVEKPKRVEAVVGSSVTFKCSARSKMPAFVVSWTKQHGMLPESRVTDFEGVLRITNVQSSDSGTYACTGSNMHGTDREMATLVVQ